MMKHLLRFFGAQGALSSGFLSCLVGVSYASTNPANLACSMSLSSSVSSTTSLSWAEEEAEEEEAHGEEEERWPSSDRRSIPPGINGETYL